PQPRKYQIATVFRSEPPAPARARPDPHRHGLLDHVRPVNRCSEAHNFRHRIFALPPARSLVLIAQDALLPTKAFCAVASATRLAARWYRLLSVSGDRPVLPARSAFSLDRRALFLQLLFKRPALFCQLTFADRQLLLNIRVTHL